MIMKQPSKKQQRQEPPKRYSQKKVDFSEILPLPEGFERFFIALYFVSIPYVVGLLFLFLFIARGNLSNFLALDIAMFISVWAIGYEIVGSTALGIIFYKMYHYNRMMRLKEEEVSVRAERMTDLYRVHKFS